jgi:hypothetical protein
VSSPREDLFEAYHSAVNSVGAAAVPLYQQALADCEDAVLERLADWDYTRLKLASAGLEQDLLHEMLCEVVDKSPWTSAHRAQAVYDGADRLGVAAEHLQGDEDGPCQQASAILTGTLVWQLADIAESHLQARIRWSMEHR